MRNNALKTIPYHTFWLLLLCCQSGCTQMLWENFNPHERKWVVSSQINEKGLESKLRTYEKCYRSVEDLEKMGIHDAGGGPLDGYLVEKSRFEKCVDYAVLGIGTPVTVAIDGALIVCAVGLELSDGELLIWLLDDCN